MNKSLRSYLWKGVAVCLSALMLLPMCGLVAFADDGEQAAETPTASEQVATETPEAPEATETTAAVATPEAVAQESAEPAAEATEASPETTEVAAQSEEVVPQANYFNVKFSVGGVEDTSLVQVVLENGVATEPANPAIPAGYRSFLGWYLNGTKFDFSSPVTADMTLEAQFSEKCLVSFTDASGKVIDTQLVAAGSTATATARLVVPPAGKEFAGWTLNGADYNFATPVNDNIFLNPKFVDASHVTFVMYFISKGSAADPQYVIDGTSATQPPNPTRAGYDFVHWSLTDGGPAYDFSTPVTADTALYAVWQAKPADYTVCYWEEKADIAGDPGMTQSNYEYYGSVTKQAVSGTSVTAVAADCPVIPYFDFSYADTQTVAGNGTTIVNVYYTRHEYQVTFDLDTGSMVFNGVTYDATNPYSFTTKYQQVIEDVWPSTKSATFIKEGMGFSGWNATGAGYYLASHRHDMTAELCDAAISNTDTLECKAYWLANTRNVDINYWLEQIPGQPSGTETMEYNGVTYEKDTTVSQTGLVISSNSSFSAKQLEGFTNVAALYAPDGSTSTNADEFNFLYSREAFSLGFDTQGGNDIATVANVPFKTELSSLKPANPTRAGYVFKGWFYDAEYNLPIDFATTTMPQNNLVVFAKWEPSQYTASFYDNVGDTTPVTTAGIALDGYVSDPGLYVAGQGYEGKGEFIGWYWYLPHTTRLINYYWETPVAGNTSLYALWRTDGFTVSYDPGEGSGIVTDPNTYSVGTLASVADGSGLTAPAGKVFVGWTKTGETTTYYPGNTVAMNSSVTLTARYEDPSNTATLTYNANFGATPETTTPMTVVKNDAVAVQPYMFSTTRPDEVAADGRTISYTFAGWSTDPAALSGDPSNTVVTQGSTIYVPGATFRTSTPATLYAVWEQALSPLSIYTIGYQWVGNAPAGAVLPDTVYAQGGDLFAATMPAAVAGYSFDGWYVDQACTTKYVDGTAVNADMTLYGKWNGSGTTVASKTGTKSIMSKTGDTFAMAFGSIFGIMALAGAAFLMNRRRRES